MQNSPFYNINFKGMRSSLKAAIFNNIFSLYAFEIHAEIIIISIISKTRQIMVILPENIIKWLLTIQGLYGCRGHAFNNRGIQCLKTFTLVNVHLNFLKRAFDANS